MLDPWPRCRALIGDGAWRANVSGKTKMLTSHVRGDFPGREGSYRAADNNVATLHLPGDRSTMQGTLPCVYRILEYASTGAEVQGSMQKVARP